MFRVNGERALALTVRAIADPDLLGRILVEGTQNRTTFSAVKLDIFELRKYASAPGYNTGYTDEVVEVRPTEVAQRRAQREVGDTNVYLRVNPFVGWVIHQDSVEGDFVEDSEHRGGRVGQKVGKNWLRHG